MLLCGVFFGVVGFFCGFFDIYMSFVQLAFLWDVSEGMIFYDSVHM
jgi:hypothetical protein